ncbi:MAG: hypothetical protein H7070_00375 [Saprospiraceae bacterium]|nr:hypothetical protein [Pyrinomonadaceae bacterium]
MFCPGCGEKNSIDKKFCRACGLNLEQSAQSLLEQFPSAKSPDLEKSERRLEKFGNVAFGGLIVVVLASVVGMIYTIFVKFILNGSGVIAGILLILFLIFAVLGLAYVAFNESLKEKRHAGPKRYGDPVLERFDTGKLLNENPFDPVPSVIEETTDLLPVENKTRKF